MGALHSKLVPGEVVTHVDGLQVRQGSFHLPIQKELLLIICIYRECYHNIRIYCFSMQVSSEGKVPVQARGQQVRIALHALI